MKDSPAIFFDRDGTLLEEVGYLSRIEDIRLIPGAARAIRKVNRAGLPVVVVTNQSAIARGILLETQFAKIQAEVSRQFLDRGAQLDATYYCPHHPEAAVPRYRLVCDCRKPGGELIRRAATDLSLDPARSVIVGDSLRDLAAGRSHGLATVLVLTGYGALELARLGETSDHPRPEFIASDILQAVNWALGKIIGEPTRPNYQQT